MPQFLNKTVFAVAMVLLLTGEATVAAADRHQKPQAPVRLVITPLQQGRVPEAIKPGDTVQLRISAAAFLDIDEMVIETSLLGGAGYVSGDRRWQGSVHQNEVKELILTVRNPLHGDGKVRARVSLFRAGEKLLTKQATYGLTAKSDSGPAKSLRPSRKDAKGREIVEQ